LTPAVLPASPLGMAVPGQFSQQRPAVVSTAPQTNNNTAVTQPTTGTNPTNGTITGTQPAGTQPARAQQAVAQESRLAALAAGTPLPPAALAMLNAGVAPGPAGLPSVGAGATGTVPLTPTTPPTTTLSVPQVVAEANGQVPATLVPLGGFNNGLLTYEMEAILSGGGGGEPEAALAAAQPNQGGGAAPARPAPVQMAPDDEIQEPQGAAPDAGPTVDGDTWPIVLAPEQGPERMPGWDLLPAAAVMPEAAVPSATRTVARTEAPVAAAEPQPSLWGRFASVACFATGALGAVWFPDVRELGTKRK
jgi:hypothetical protein